MIKIQCFDHKLLIKRIPKPNWSYINKHVETFKKKNKHVVDRLLYCECFPTEVANEIIVVQQTCEHHIYHRLMQLFVQMQLKNWIFE